MRRHARRRPASQSPGPGQRAATESTPAGTPTPYSVNDTVKISFEQAWRTHNAQETWTQRIDAKTSVTLALEGGALFALLAGHSQTGLLATNNLFGHIAELAGLAFLVTAVLVAVWTLIPQLGSNLDHRANYKNHTIYFGHIRHWTPHELANALRSAGDEDPFPMLARQLIAMSQRNWNKYRRLQCSIVFGAIGVVCICGAALSAVLAR